MSTDKRDVALVGAGAAACAVCCAGPIVGFLTALGLGAALGFAIFGIAGLAVAALAIVVVPRRRRARKLLVSIEQTMDLLRRQ
ncbi:MAG: hypothetical protein ABI949_14390 [Ilumatobacteraceae bacterium]